MTKLKFQGFFMISSGFSQLHTDVIVMKWWLSLRQSLFHYYKSYYITKHLQFVLLFFVAGEILTLAITSWLNTVYMSNSSAFNYSLIFSKKMPNPHLLYASISHHFQSLISKTITFLLVTVLDLVSKINVGKQVYLVSMILTI